MGSVDVVAAFKQCQLYGKINKIYIGKIGNLIQLNFIKSIVRLVMREFQGVKMISRVELNACEFSTFLRLRS